MARSDDAPSREDVLKRRRSDGGIPQGFCSGLQGPGGDIGEAGVGGEAKDKDVNSS